MQDVLVAGVIVAVLAVCLVGLVLMAARVRRRGSGGGYSLMGPFDEMWHPAALAARLEVEVQDERAAEAPLPGDRLF